MNLYMVRHGETVWNAEDKVCGISDIDLNEKGIAQARQVAGQLEHLKIDRLIASPLKRAQVTAEIIAARHEGLEIETDARIIEQNYGIYEGQYRTAPGYHEAKVQFAAPLPRGESLLQIAQRTYNFLDELTAAATDQTVLLVCHKSVGRSIHSYFEPLSNEAYATYEIENCEVKKYVI